MMISFLSERVSLNSYIAKKGIRDIKLPLLASCINNEILDSRVKLLRRCFSCLNKSTISIPSKTKFEPTHSITSIPVVFISFPLCPNANRKIVTIHVLLLSHTSTLTFTHITQCSNSSSNTTNLHSSPHKLKERELARHGSHLIHEPRTQITSKDSPQIIIGDSLQDLLKTDFLEECLWQCLFKHASAERDVTPEFFVVLEFLIEFCDCGAEFIRQDRPGTTAPFGFSPDGFEF